MTAVLCAIGMQRGLKCGVVPRSLLSIPGSASHDMTARLWDVSSGGSFRCKRTLRGHEHAVTGITFVRVSSASGGEDSAGGEAAASGASSSATQERVATASRDSTVRVWDPESGSALGVLYGHKEWARQVAAVPPQRPGSIFPDVPNVLVSCSSDKTVRVWDAGSMEAGAVLSGHENVVECVALSSREQATVMRRTFAASAAVAEAVGAADGSVDASVAASGVFAGLYAVSGDRNCKIIVWDLAASAAVAELSGHSSWVRGVSFHPHGCLVVSASEDRTLRVWDVARGATRVVVEGCHRDFVAGLALHSTLPLFATAGLDGVAKVWACS